MPRSHKVLMRKGSIESLLQKFFSPALKHETYSTKLNVAWGIIQTKKGLNSDWTDIPFNRECLFTWINGVDNSVGIFVIGCEGSVCWTAWNSGLPFTNSEVLSMSFFIIQDFCVASCMTVCLLTIYPVLWNQQLDGQEWKIILSHTSRRVTGKVLLAFFCLWVSG